MAIIEEQNKTFRPRAEGESMTAYLQSKQTGNTTGNPPVMDATTLTTPQTPLNFKTPEAQQIPAFPEIPAPIQTEKEAETTATIKRIQELTGQTTGKEAFRAELELSPELEAQRKTETDLTAQLTQLSAEAKQIPLQLQQEAKGRGITAGGLMPIQTERLRTNAIQALGASALLDATRGNITSALDKIDRQVQAKYGDVEARLKAEQANLDLISRLPDLTAKEKAQAEERKFALDKRDLAMADEKQKFKDIQTISVEAAKAGADALTLRNISQSKSPTEAAQIMYDFSLRKQAKDTLNKVSREGAITGLINQGITDPAQILDYLNYDQQGNLIGDITFDEVRVLLDANREAVKEITDIKKTEAEIENIRNQIYSRGEQLRLDTQKLALSLKALDAKDIKEEDKKIKTTELEAESALGVQSLISDLLSHDKLKLATGFTSIFPTLPGFGTRDFNLTHQQLKDSLTKDNLSALRGLGAMSDRELLLIEKSATKLDLSLPEDQYVAELNKIQDLLNPTFEKAIDLEILDPITIGASLGFNEEDLLEMSNMGMFQSTEPIINDINPSDFY